MVNYTIKESFATIDMEIGGSWKNKTKKSDDEIEHVQEELKIV